MFLDAGTGVGVVAIELCRHYPHLHAVGLEPQAVPLAEARRNVAAAQLDQRIELRAQRVEDLTDREAFDLAYLPQVFMPVEVVRRGLRTVFQVLRPGGCCCRRSAYWARIWALRCHGCGAPSGVGRRSSRSRLQKWCWRRGSRPCRPAAPLAARHKESWASVRREVRPGTQSQERSEATPNATVVRQHDGRRARYRGRARNRPSQPFAAPLNGYLCDIRLYPRLL